MTTSILISVLIFLPIVSGIIAFAINNEKVKYFALGASLIEFLISLAGILNYTPSPGFSNIENHSWIASMGISYYVGADGISFLLVMLTTFLVPLIILSSFRHSYVNSKLFYSLILLMQGALVGVFVSLDAFLFYIFWELALIPIYFISLLWGGNDRIKVTLKFFIYTLVGSLFMLLGIIYLYLQTSTGSFEIAELYKVSLGKEAQMLVFWCFFLAFAIKMPIFPFHTWQPDTYSSSPTQGTMLLSGIMLKMGIYGVIRWMLPIVPIALSANWGGTLAILLSIVGIIYASIIAIMQKDLKRLIAYVSIAHVGLIGAGIFTGTLEGIQGAVFQMLSHGINVVGLFFIVDIIFDRTKTYEISKLGGIKNVAPHLSFYFIIILLGSVSLPLTSGFVGEFLLFIGVYKYNIYLAGIAGLTIILGAVYMLSTYQKAMLGEVNNLTTKFIDLFPIEKAVLIPIVIMIIWMGIYPKPFLNISEPAVKHITEMVTSYTSLK
jgi:NADH-quinone oxidoreductase subunit M